MIDRARGSRVAGCFAERSWGVAAGAAGYGVAQVAAPGNGYPADGRSGLGYHQALALAVAGADVTIASRDRAKGEEAVRRMVEVAPGAAIRFGSLDLTDPASIETFAVRMGDTGDSLDLLINNAGVMGRSDRETTADGLERVFATNALGPYALSARLRPLLSRGNAPRIVWTASMRGHAATIDFDDLQQVDDYDYARAYDDTKLGNLLLASECQRRSMAEGWAITSIAAHPGVARTNIVLDGPGPDSSEGRRFRFVLPLWQDPAVGALPALYAATAPQAAGGGYYGPQGFRGLRGAPVRPPSRTTPSTPASLLATGTPSSSSAVSRSEAPGVIRSRDRSDNHTTCPPQTRTTLDDSSLRRIS